MGKIYQFALIGLLMIKEIILKTKQKPTLVLVRQAVTMVPTKGHNVT